MKITQVPVKSIKEYENNNKIHTPSQMVELKKSIGEFGFNVPLIVDENFQIICGHGRFQAGKELGLKKIPCVVKKGLTEKQKKKYRLLDNKISDMSLYDLEKIEKELQDIGSVELADLFNIEIDTSSIDQEEEKPQENNKNYDSETSSELLTDGRSRLINDSAIYPTDNQYDIPQLKEDMLCDRIPDFTIYGNKDPDLGKGVGFGLYGNIAYENYGGNIIHFYEDDERFNKVRENATAIIDQIKDKKVVGMLSPDFSCYNDYPIAFQIFQVYKAMRVARTRQENGIKIIPSILASGKRNYDFTFIGLPKKIPLIAIQIRTGGKQRHYGLKELMQEITNRISFGKILIYGGYEKQEELKKIIDTGIDYVPLMTWNTKKKLTLENK